MSRLKRIFLAIILGCLILTGCSEAKVNTKLEIVNSSILDALDAFHANELYLFKNILIQVLHEEKSEKIKGMFELYLLNNNKSVPYILSLNNSTIIPIEDSTILIELYKKLHEYVNLLNSRLENKTLKNYEKEVEELIKLIEKSPTQSILSKENMVKNESLLITLNKKLENK